MALPQIFFAWTNATDTTFTPAFQRYDENLYSFVIEHTEGNIPILTVDMQNPHIGLLAAGRKVWAWFAWTPDGGITVYPLFFGRLVGIPSNMLEEVITLQFMARADNFISQKQTITETVLKLGNYDPIFVPLQKRDDPDTCLEGWSAMWHIDRVSLAWSISDILIGEDGTETFNAIDTFRDSVKETIKQPPLVAVGVMGTVSWNQAFRGYIPLEPAIYTSLLSGVSQNWPAPLTGLGSGWTIAYSISGETLNLNNISNQTYSFTWHNADTVHQDGDIMSVTIESNIGSDPSGGKITFMQIGVNDPFAVDIEGDPAPVNTPAITIYSKPLIQNTSVRFGGALILQYEAARQRTERLSFILSSNVQPLITDPLITQDTEYLNINGDDVGVPILQLLNWTAVQSSNVSLGQLIFPDDPSLPGQTSTQICTHPGLTGSVEPIFSNVAGATTPDGTAIWTSLGDTQPSETAPDWPAFTQMPLGAMILPRVPVSLPWAYLEIQGAVQNPPTGFNVGLSQVVLAPSGDYWVCIVSGMTTGLLGLIGQESPGTIIIDGDAEWGCIGLTLPPGNVYWICTQPGVTGRILPSFDPTLGHITNDGTAQWTSIGPADVPIGGYPGNTPNTSYWPTVRAQQSIAYLIALARARLRLRARAVEVSFDCRFERAIQLSCRQNAVVFDPRLPSGSAAGKIIAYKISVNGDTQELIGNVTIGCAVGTHSSVVITPGTPTYVNGYVNGYQVYTGTVLPVGDDVGYTPPAYAPYDDGLTFPLTESEAVIESGLIGETNQAAQITQTVFAALAALGQVPVGSVPFNYFTFIANANADLQSRLNATFANYPVFYKLGLNPVQNGPFAGFYSMGTTGLVIPELINLSGPSTP